MFFLNLFQKIMNFRFFFKNVKQNFEKTIGICWNKTSFIFELFNFIKRIVIFSSMF